MIDAYYNGIKLKDVQKQLRGFVSKREYFIGAIKTDPKNSKKYKLAMSLQKLMFNPDMNYFSLPTRLILGSEYVTLADVVNIMEQRGQKISRSGCEDKILRDVKKFVTDFGTDILNILMDDDTVSSDDSLAVLEVKLLAYKTGIDYTDNALDNLLKKFDLSVYDTGSTSTEQITSEKIQEVLDVLEPYTTKGLQATKEKLKEYGPVLWHLRKALINGTDVNLANYVKDALL